MNTTEKQDLRSVYPLLYAARSIITQQPYAREDILITVAAIFIGSTCFSAERKLQALVEAMEANPWYSEALKQQNYKSFLQDDYWLLLREVVLEERGRACHLCTSTSRLQIHHKTYKHRGSEYKHREDLIILCDGCHAKFHDKLPKEE